MEHGASGSCVPSRRPAGSAASSWRRISPCPWMLPTATSEERTRLGVDALSQQQRPGSLPAEVDDPVLPRSGGIC